MRYLGLPPRPRRNPGAFGGFVPTSIPGCVAWYRADLGISLDGTSKVQTWSDQSGFGNHLSQATTGQRPVMGTLNGKPTVVFSRALSTWVDNTALAGFPTNVADVKKITYFIVYNPTANNAGLININAGVLNTDNGHTLYVLNGGSTHTRALKHGGTSTSTGYANPLINVARYTCDYWTAADNFLKSRQGGVYQVQSAAITLTSLAPTALRVGAWFPNSPAFEYSGDVGEVLVYNRELTLASELQVVEAYLAKFWSL